jgi:O-antigen/teichoic acid export membrane protein
VFLITTIVAASATVAVIVLPDRWLPAAEVYDYDHLRLTFFLLTLYAMVSLHGSVTLAGLRCSGNYAIGTFVMAIVLLLEGIALISAAYFAKSFWIASLALLCTRAAGLTTLTTLLRRKVSWLTPGFKKASVWEMRRLLSPAIAVTSLTLSDIIGLQGMILIIGKMISPAAVAVFSATRTLTRVGVLTTTLFNNTFLPEFSAAIATDDSLRKARLIAANMFVVAVVAVATFVVLGFYGRDIIYLWTHGGIDAPLTVILLLAIAANLRSLWQSGALILLSANRHGTYAPIVLVVSIATMFVAVVLSRTFGITGAAASVVGMETVMLVFVIHFVRSGGFIDSQIILQNLKTLPNQVRKKVFR